MAEEKGDKGGLMYQQLRKFINVIVSALSASHFVAFSRMNSVMSVCNNSSSCPEFVCSEDSQQVRVQCSSQSLVSTSCPEEMVSSRVDLSSFVSTTSLELNLGPGSKKSQTRSSLTSKRSSRPLISSLTKCVVRAKILLTNQSC